MIDFDNAWAEVLGLSNLLVTHVCMLTDDSLGINNIVFESDADGGTLPVSCANTSITCAYNGFLFVEAQGLLLKLIALILHDLRLDVPPAFRNDVLRNKEVMIGCGGGFHQELVAIQSSCQVDGGGTKQSNTHKTKPGKDPGKFAN